MEPVMIGYITFDGHKLPFYKDPYDPLFRGSDILELIGYSDGNTSKMLQMCEDDEKLSLPLVISGQRRRVSFVTERGLYNILSQSRVPLARKWRRVIFDELVRIRREKNFSVPEMFEEWDHRLDDIWFDEETGIMMQAVTVAGGDVECIPLKEG